RAGVGSGHAGGLVYTRSVGSIPPGVSIVGARRARCGFQLSRVSRLPSAPGSTRSATDCRVSPGTGKRKGRETNVSPGGPLIAPVWSPGPAARSSDASWVSPPSASRQLGLGERDGPAPPVARHPRLGDALAAHAEVGEAPGRDGDGHEVAAGVAA